MTDTYYLIDNHFGAQPLTAYLAQDQTRWGQELVGRLDRDQLIGEASGPDLPITPNGQLQPGVLYESTTDPNKRFYLPEYQLHVVDGLYTTRLKWRDEHDDPDGPLAFLTVEVSGRPVLSGDLIYAELPHQAVATIIYQLPVQNSVRPPFNPAAFLGNWNNTDLRTQGLTRLEILPLSEGQVQFHAFGKCSPADCDWGLIPAQQEGESFVGTYDFGFKQTRITVRRHNNLLTAELFHHFQPGDGRPDRAERETLAGGSLAGQSADDTQPVLQIKVGALEPSGDGVRRARLPIAEKREFDRIYQVMTDSNFNSRLEIRCFATMGRRTWRQLVLAPSDLTTQNTLLTQKKVLATDLLGEKQPEPSVGPDDPNRQKVILTGPPTAPINLKEVTELTNPTVISRIKETGTLPILSPGVTDQLVKQVTTVNRLNPQLFRPVGRAVAPQALPAQPADQALTATQLLGRVDKTVLGELVVQPVLARAFARPLPELLTGSDLHVRIDNREVNAVPTRAILAEDGRPALIQVTVENSQELAPFWFPVATNAYVFDLGNLERPSGNHILIPYEVRGGDGTVRLTFYQDSAYTDQFYYRPQEFRIPRLTVPPFLPDLRVAFLNLMTQADNTSADPNAASLLYKVLLGYRALPYIDPLLLDLAQQQVPEVKANFTALAPVTTHLSLRLPEDEQNGNLTEVARPAAKIYFDQGIIDEVELSRSEFERIFSYFQSASGVGIEGEVTAALLGNLTTHVPVKLSFKQHSGPVFAHTYLGPVGAGLHRVRLLNRIESAVTITGFYQVALGGDRFAFPSTTSAVEVQPGATLELDYSVTRKGEPINDPVGDIYPALATSVNVDALSLWPKLFVNQGYTNDTFPLTVTSDPSFFGVTPPGADAPLTAVKVTFGDGSTVTLTAERPQATVTLRMPLLPRLLGSGQAKQYRYWVTNLLGSDGQAGAESAEQAGEGDTELTVVPAGA